MRRWAVVVVATMVLGAGCLDGRYQCKSSGECSLDGVPGRCEASGFCSFPDPSCAPTARRYGELADAAHRDRCVDDELDGGCVRAVAAGGAHSCLVKRDGTLWCWGTNQAGQLGNGSVASGAVPVAVTDDAGRGFGDVADVDAGLDFTCARRIDGSVWCWGSGQRLAGGDAAGDIDQPHPRQVRTAAGALDGVVQVSAGATHACAVRVDGSVWCWGAGDTGQLGDGAPAEQRIAAPVRRSDGSALDGANLVAAGAGFSCAARATAVWCWGSNMFGQLGQPGGPASSANPLVALASEAIAIAAGGGHACAIESDGSAWCWGRAEDGQIGEPGLPGVGVAPVRVQSSGGGALAGARSIAAGEAHSCASGEDGRVRCWGAGDSGQIGEPGRASAEVAIDVLAASSGAALGDVFAVDAGVDDYHAEGGRHSCARGRDAVWCWGAGEGGALGDGRMQSGAAAVAVDLSSVCR